MGGKTWHFSSQIYGTTQGSEQQMSRRLAVENLPANVEWWSQQGDLGREKETKWRLQQVRLVPRKLEIYSSSKWVPWGETWSHLGWWVMISSSKSWSHPRMIAAGCTDSRRVHRTIGSRKMGLFQFVSSSMVNPKQDSTIPIHQPFG